MELLQVIQQSIRHFFLALPLILISLMAFLGIGLGNKGMLFVFAGQVVIVPIAVFLLQFMTSFLGGLAGLERLFKVNPSEIVQMVPSAPLSGDLVNVSPSFWLTQVVFFFMYVFMNAYSVYNMPAVDETISQQWRVENRQARAMMSMIAIGVLAFIIIVSRWSLTGAEKPMGVILSLGLGGTLGYYWYRVAGLAGARNADIFGVVQQMVKIDSTQVTTCKPA